VVGPGVGAGVGDVDGDGDGVGDVEGVGEGVGDVEGDGVGVVDGEGEGDGVVPPLGSYHESGATGARKTLFVLSQCVARYEPAAGAVL